MKRIMDDVEKTQCSFRCTKELKENLEHFASYSRKSEGQIICAALQQYFHSDKAFTELISQEKAKREWFEAFYENQHDFLNYVGDPSLLIRHKGE